jgi:hypothetical protein
MRFQTILLASGFAFITTGLITDPAEAAPKVICELDIDASYLDQWSVTPLCVAPEDSVTCSACIYDCGAVDAYDCYDAADAGACWELYGHGQGDPSMCAPEFELD